MLYKDYKDSKVSAAGIEIPTGCKWNAKKTVEGRVAKKTEGSRGDGGKRSSWPGLVSYYQSL